MIVIDSQFVSLGLGFQAIAAAEAALTQPVESVLESASLKSAGERV